MHPCGLYLMPYFASFLASFLASAFALPLALPLPSPLDFLAAFFSALAGAAFAGSAFFVSAAGAGFAGGVAGGRADATPRQAGANTSSHNLFLPTSSFLIKEYPPTTRSQPG